jgi:hypothetical protein
LSGEAVVGSGGAFAFAFEATATTLLAEGAAECAEAACVA